MPTVSETANEPPQEELDHYNSPSSLAREALRVNEAFSQQCLRPEAGRAPAANPFAKSGEEPASTVFRYRRWKLGDYTLIAR